MHSHAAPLLTIGNAVAFVCADIADTAQARDAAAADALSRHAGAPVPVIRRASGRPALAPPWRELGVSLSYRDGFLLCGFSADHDVGADIERIDHALDTAHLARDHFARGECEALARLAKAEADALFFRLWSAKEAVLKATGRGIHDGLAHIDCSASIPALGSDGLIATVALPNGRKAQVTTRIIATKQGRRYSTALAILI